MFDNINSTKASDQNSNSNGGIKKENTFSHGPMPPPIPNQGAKEELVKKQASEPVSNTAINPVTPEKSATKESRPPGVVEDIFAETDTVVPNPRGIAKSSIFKPKTDNAAGQNSLPVEPSSKPKMGKLLILGMLAVGLIFISVGSFFIYRMVTGDTDNADTIPVIDDIGEAADNNQVQKQPATVPDNKNLLPDEPDTKNEKLPVEDIDQDTDQDGLTDKEERAIGTDINNQDTDNDNLFDREEVRVYKTDPLNPDTDGDGYLDGDEVSNQFNPKGAGKLYELK